MTIWGKIFGGVAGFMIGGPLGALIGAAGGYWWDKQNNNQADVDDYDKRNNLNKSLSQRHVIFSTAVVVLSAKIAKADGVVTSEEIDVFKRIIQISDDDKIVVTNLYHQAQQNADGYEIYATQAAQTFGHGATVLEELLWLLTEIAKADDKLHQTELRMLRHIAHLFGLSNQVFERINALEHHSVISDPYLILGISNSMKDSDIRAHYHTLVRKYHPDRLIAQGLPTEAIEASGRKLAAINQAYDIVKKQRRL